MTPAKAMFSCCDRWFVRPARCDGSVRDAWAYGPQGSGPICTAAEVYALPPGPTFADVHVGDVFDARDPRDPHGPTQRWAKTCLLAAVMLVPHPSDMRPVLLHRSWPVQLLEIREVPR